MSSRGQFLRALALGALIGVLVTRVHHRLVARRRRQSGQQPPADGGDELAAALGDLSLSPELPPVELDPSLAHLEFGSDEARALFFLASAPAAEPAAGGLLHRPGAPLTFLNHGSFGAVPRPVLAYYESLLRRVESAPDVWFRLHSWPLTRLALQPVAALLRCDAADLVFCNNATSAVNAVLQSIGGELQPGDVLLATDATYNACKLAMRHAAQQHNAQYAEITLPFPLQSDEQVIQCFEAEIARLQADGRRVRFLLVDTITSPTGVVLPWRSLARLARRLGIRCMVDGAHGVGHLDIDLSSGDVDYFTSNLHKWAWGVKGSALLFAHPAVQAGLRPLVTSHHHGDGFRRAFWMQATRDDTAYLASAVAGLAFAQAVGIERARQYSSALLERGCALFLRRFAEEAPRLAQGRPNAAAWKEAAAATAAAPFICAAGLRTPHLRLVRLPFPVPDAAAARAPLAERIGMRLLQRYGVVTPVVYEPHTQALWIRLSAHIYNNDADYERAVECLLHWARQDESQAMLNGRQ